MPDPSIAAGCVGVGLVGGDGVSGAGERWRAAGTAGLGRRRPWSRRVACGVTKRVGGLRYLEGTPG